MPNTFNDIPYMMPDDIIASAPSTSLALARAIDARLTKTDAELRRDFIAATSPGVEEAIEAAQNLDSAAAVAALRLELARVTPGSWVPLTLINGWKGYSGSGYYSGLRYRRVAEGIQIHGAISSGPNGTDIARLPTADRPKHSIISPVRDSGGSCDLFTYTNGYLKPQNGTNTPAWLSINVIIPID